MKLVVLKGLVRLQSSPSYEHIRRAFFVEGLQDLSLNFNAVPYDAKIAYFGHVTGLRAFIISKYSIDTRAHVITPHKKYIKDLWDPLTQSIFEGIRKSRLEDVRAAVNAADYCLALFHHLLLDHTPFSASSFSLIP